MDEQKTKLITYIAIIFTDVRINGLNSKHEITCYFISNFIKIVMSTL